MNLDDQNERLEAIVARFFVPKPRTLLEAASAPFDTSKPNSHETKADFLAEQAAVESALKDANSLLGFLMTSFREEEPGYNCAKHIRQFVDVSAKQSIKREKLETIADLIRKNTSETEFSFTFTLLLIDFSHQLSKRKQELESQEAIFWTGKGRSPNHYARAIALRFAKLIARGTGKRPTFGTSSDGSHPSTEFGRALQEVFDLLGIKANVRHPAKWAIDQIRDEDLQPEPVNRLAYSGMGSIYGTSHPGNALANYSNLLAKGE